MSLTFKKASRDDLRKVSVYIEDNTPTSPNYFRMSNVPEVLTKGKNLIRISAHPTNLVDNTPILIDVRDSNGDPIYYEIPEYIEEDKSRVISIWIYHDKGDDNTPNGIATITILGTSKYGRNGEAIPTNFSGKPNVKWQTVVSVDRNRKSDTSIIFDSLSLPTLIVSESIEFYESIPTTGTALTETTVTSNSATYIYKGTTPIIKLNDTTFNNEMIGGSITSKFGGTQLPVATKPNPLTSDYVTTIKSLINSTTAIVESPFTTKFEGLGDETHTYTSGESGTNPIRYVSTGSNVITTNQQSFANITLNSMEPVSGVVDKIKILMKTEGFKGDYELLSTNTVPFTSSISLKLAIPTEQTSDPISFKIQYLNAAGDISITETVSDPYAFTGVPTSIGDLDDITITSASMGDLLVFGDTEWENTKVLSGSYHITGSLSVTGTVTAGSYAVGSDIRLKENVVILEPNHIEIDWKSFNMKRYPDDYRTGVIAQELEVTHPEFVITDNNGMKAVKYIDLLIAKIAELEHKITQLSGLQTRIESLESGSNN